MASVPSANDLLAAFLADSEESVIGFHLDGNIFLWNRASEVLYGHAASEICGKSIEHIFPPCELPILKESLCRPEQLGSYTDVPSTRLNKAGLLLHLRVSRSVVRSPQGGKVCVLERARAFLPDLPGASADVHLQFLVEKMPFFSWTTDQRLRIASHWGNQLRRVNRPAINPVGNPFSSIFAAGQSMRLR